MNVLIKSFRFIVFIMIFTLVLPLFACNANVNRVNLDELPDNMVAGYKTSFELPHILNGGTSIDYKVFDKDGNEVTVVSSCFLVEKTTDYTVEASVGTEKKIIKVTVEDLSAPIILSHDKELRYVLVNTEIELPSYSVIDNFDQNPSIKCTLTFNHENIGFNDNCFTPTSIGEYVFSIISEDNSKNVSEKTFIINAVATVEETYKIFAFDVSIDYVDYMTDYTVYYNQDERFCFPGEKGSTKMSLNTSLTDPVFSFKNQLIDTSEFSSIYYYVYNDSDYEFAFHPNIASGGYVNSAMIKPHEWSKVIIVNMEPYPAAPSITENHSDITGFITSCNRGKTDHYGKTVDFYFSAVYGVK